MRSPTGRARAALAGWPGLPRAGCACSAASRDEPGATQGRVELVGSGRVVSGPADRRISSARATRSRVASTGFHSNATARAQVIVRPRVGRARLRAENRSSTPRCLRAAATRGSTAHDLNLIRDSRSTASRTHRSLIPCNVRAGCEGGPALDRSVALAASAISALIGAARSTTRDAGCHLRDWMVLIAPSDRRANPRRSSARQRGIYRRDRRADSRRPPLSLARFRAYARLPAIASSGVPFRRGTFCCWVRRCPGDRAGPRSGGLRLLVLDEPPPPATTSARAFLLVDAISRLLAECLPPMGIAR